MSGFEPIVIEWKGTPFTVPPTRCMGLLAAVEEILAPGQNGSAIEVLANPHRAHLTKLARAYATALRYAGCPVSDEDVYLSLSSGIAKGGQDGFEALKTLGDAMLVMFFPSWSQVDQGEPSGNGQGAKAKTADAPSEMELSGASTD